MNSACSDIIALNLISGLGPRRVLSLIKSVQTTEEIFCMPDFKMRKIISNADLIRRIRSAKKTAEYAKELAYISEEGITPVCLKDDSYPENLKNIYDPPPVLYCKGALCEIDADAVAIVGSRRCSSYGLQMAERIAFDLAKEGITVVSGMARGIDTAAHRGAIKAGGRTIAVMGSGFGYIYPPEAEELIDAVCGNGAVITEYSHGTVPLKGNFPRRNRVISGLSKGVVIVEAARKSGAIITADFALDQGREVFAVPGRADFYTSYGSNMLIKDGAKLVMNAGDILEELKIEKKQQFKETHITGGKQPARGMSAFDKTEDYMIIKLLKTEVSPMHIDRIFEHTGIEPGRLPAVLLGMQIRKLIKELPGKNYVLANEAVSLSMGREKISHPCQDSRLIPPAAPLCGAKRRGSLKG